MSTQEQKDALDRALCLATFGETPESIDKILEESKASKDKNKKPKVSPTKKIIQMQKPSYPRIKS